MNQAQVLWGRALVGGISQSDMATPRHSYEVSAHKVHRALQVELKTMKVSSSKPQKEHAADIPMEVLEGSPPPRSSKRRSKHSRESPTTSRR